MWGGGQRGYALGNLCMHYLHYCTTSTGGSARRGGGGLLTEAVPHLASRCRGQGVCAVSKEASAAADHNAEHNAESIEVKMSPGGSEGAAGSSDVGGGVGGRGVGGGESGGGGSEALVANDGN